MEQRSLLILEGIVTALKKMVLIISKNCKDSYIDKHKTFL